MYVRDLAQSLLRRWYLVVVGLLLTTGLGVLVFRAVPPSYSADASVVLLPPANTVGEEGNPFLYLGGLTQALDVLTRALGSDGIRGPIEDAHPGVEFDAQPDRTTSGPMLLVTAQGPDPGHALAALAELTDAVPGVLRRTQAELEIPEPWQITSLVVTSDDEATSDQKARLRATAAAAIGGAALTVLVAGLLDGLLSRRRDEGATVPAGEDQSRPRRRRRG